MNTVLSSVSQMFHPTSNRVAAFLEISALSIALAKSGGAQYKAGNLRIEAVAMKGTSLFSRAMFSSSKEKEEKGSIPFGRKSASWSQRKEQRWCAVRESYLVAMEEPGELTVWDVFLLDPEFRIERPKRVYRQGLGGFFQDSDSDDEGDVQHKSEKNQHDNTLLAVEKEGRHGGTLKVKDEDAKSVLGSVKSRVSKIFHPTRHRSRSTNDLETTKHQEANRRGSASLGKASAGKNHERASTQTTSSGQRPTLVSQEGYHGMNHYKSSGSDSDISTSLTRQSSMIRSETESEGGDGREGPVSHVRSDSASTLSGGALTPMLDPSTNLDPTALLRAGEQNTPAKFKELAKGHDDSGAESGGEKQNGDHQREKTDQEKEDEKRKVEQAIRDHQRQLRLKEQQKRSEGKDMSKHTFYISNSQMRLKLYARNEVRRSVLRRSREMEVEVQPLRSEANAAIHHSPGEGCTSLPLHEAEPI